MVFTASSNVLPSIRSATLDEVHSGRKVLFLRNISAGFPTLQAGRLGWITDVRPSDGRIRVSNLRRDNSRWVDVGDVALVGKEVHPGDTIVDVSDPVRSYSRINGQHAVVESVHGLSVRARLADGTGYGQLVSDWVVVGEQVPPEPISEDNLRISQWWVDRIVQEARSEGKRRNWCSELDAVLKRIFEPLPKAQFKAEDVEDTDGGKRYRILNPQGEEVAMFSEAEDATEYVRNKNSKLEVKYTATLP